MATWKCGKTGNVKRKLNKLSREIANNENQYEENWLKIAANFVSGQLPTFQLKINNVNFKISHSGNIEVK